MLFPKSKKKLTSIFHTPQINPHTSLQPLQPAAATLETNEAQHDVKLQYVQGNICLSYRQ